MSNQKFYLYEIRDFFPFIQLRKLKKQAQGDETYVYIKDLIKDWGDGFILKEPFLSIINNINSREEDSLGLLVNLSSEELLKGLESKMRSFLSKNLDNRINLVIGSEEKYTSSIPLARLKVEFIKQEEAIIKSDEQINPKVIAMPKELTRIELMKAIHRY